LEGDFGKYVPHEMFLDSLMEQLESRVLPYLTLAQNLSCYFNMQDHFTFVGIHASKLMDNLDFVVAELRAAG
jgi:hypothetical protein